MSDDDDKVVEGVVVPFRPRGEVEVRPEAEVERKVEGTVDTVPRPVARAGEPVAHLVGRRRPVLDPDAPILPGWLREADTFTAAARSAGRRWWYRVRWSIVWLPLAALMLIVRFPVGVMRLLGEAARYLYDAQSAGLRGAVTPDGSKIGKDESTAYTAVQKERRANLHARWRVAGLVVLALCGPPLAWWFPTVLGVVVGLAVFVLTCWAIPKRSLGEVGIAAILGSLFGLAAWYFGPSLPQPPAWVLWLVLFVAVEIVGWVGRPLNRPLVMSASTAVAPVAPLTPDLVMRALCSLGSAQMKEPEQIGYLAPGLHRAGPGVQGDFELPGAVPASYVMEHREELAAAMRRELACVWPSVGARHPGHLVLYVSDVPLNKAVQPPWPLLKAGSVDLFQPFPAFTDQRGKWVTITLAYANMIIGAVPRMGKTFVLRMLLLCAGLDPRAKVAALDGKGTGDLSPCRLFAHFYSVGDDEDEIDRVLQFLRGLREEMRRRARVVRELPSDICPENKVTSALADLRRLDLAPWVVGMDETQAYFDYGEKKNKQHIAIREEMAAIVADLVKRGPALGIIVLLATQNVNATTIPTAISNNAVMRFCLKVAGQRPNDDILGTGAYKRGLNAAMFDLADKGIGYLMADGAEAIICRSVFGLDAPTSEKVAARARTARLAAGLLSGDAAGEDEAEEAAEVDLLADALTALGNADRMHLGPLRDLMADRWPARYGHVPDGPALGVALREAGARTGQVKVDGTNLAGVRSAWLAVSATGDEPGVERDDDEEEATVVDLPG